MKNFFLLITFLSFTNIFSQELSEYEKPPVFPDCESESVENLRTCFYNNISKFVYENFKIPEIVNNENYKGNIVVLFEVNARGEFVVLYVDAIYEELKKEVKRVFAELPEIKPSTYNGRPTYKQYSYQIDIPLTKSKTNIEIVNAKTNKNTVLFPLTLEESKEIESIKNGDFDRQKKFKSQLNIPLSHEVYSRFDKALNRIGVNTHTASRPFLYDVVNNHHDFESILDSLQLDKSSWFGRKFFNEHMVRFQGDNYWFTIDPAADLQLGVETDERKEDNITYNNTRAIFVQGGIGKKFSFFSAIYESQGRFAQYFNDFARSIRPAGGNPAVIPGRGIADESRAGDFDYPVAEGYISYTPSKYFNFQFGTGQHFIGDGYRSLLLSDVSSNYPYFKINTTFWKIKYTNTFLSLRDIRPEATDDGAFGTKFAVNHYLSYNINKKLNIGLFESVIFLNEDNSGVDLSLLNPIIFLRNVEFQRGSRGGNALIGATAKYKFSNRFNIYGQLIIDELQLSQLTNGSQNFRNKHGYQLGFKYYDAFNVSDLTLQLEYNQVRPFTFSNNDPALSFTNANQPLAHPFGANFREFIAIARYRSDRWYGAGRLIYGQRGFEDDINNVFFGGNNLFGSEDNRPSDNGNELLQGNRVNSIYADLEIGYLLNPATNLKLFINPIYRDFSPETETETVFKTNTLWFNVGFRTDLFNWYFDN
ncbi:gliding motility protein RemB [Flavobacteriaceae bacterium AU392]|nr:gliding motility protein RemB [Flavobacteriaceae bacterium]RKM81639.1 gliding motility protein RemB [Flavobacteriaceae bacterium AU392]